MFLHVSHLLSKNRFEGFTPLYLKYTHTAAVMQLLAAKIALLQRKLEICSLSTLKRIPSELEENRPRCGRVYMRRDKPVAMFRTGRIHTGRRGI